VATAGNAASTPVITFTSPVVNTGNLPGKEDLQKLAVMPMTHAPETGARNRFFTPVAKFLAPETNTDE